MSKNNKNLFSLTVLGSRGSIPISSPDKVRYGGNTSCYLVETDKEAIILDAGSGIQNLPDLGDKRKSLLITHTHMDHIVGLPAFLTRLWGKELAIFGAAYEGLSIKQQLDRYISRPLWPITIEDHNIKTDIVNIDWKSPKGLEVSTALGNNIIYEEGIVACFNIGDVKVFATPSNHPGGSTLFRLEYAGRSIVYATDFEHEELPAEKRERGAEPIDASSDGGSSETPLERLAKFSKGADLIMYDAQYTPEEYEKCRGFGHSTYIQALELKEKTGAGEILLIHHNPSHTDDFMDKMADEVAALSADGISFAKEGMIIEL